MSGRPAPDVAFLHNVPTSLPSSSSTSSIPSVTSSTPTSTSTSSSTSLTPTSITQAPAATPSSISNVNHSISVYPYDPSVTFATAFAVLFSILAIYHFYWGIYKPYISKSVNQKHKITIPLFAACLFFTIGFAVRVLSASTEENRSSFGLYAVSTTFILVAPTPLCATLYLLVTYLIRLCLPEGSERVYLGIKPSWLARIFILSDVVCLLCQVVGVAVAASGKWRGQAKDTGTGVLLFGLSAQLVIFSVYLAVLTLFCLRVRSGRAEEKSERVISVTGESDSFQDQGEKKRRDFGFNPLVKQVIKGMWIASVLVEVRCIYRLIDFAAGTDAIFFKHEWPLGVFDAAPMWCSLLALGYFHPVKWLQQKKRSAFIDKYVRTSDDRLPR